MRRLSLVLAAVLLTAGLLAGCGNPPAPPAVPSVDGTSTETPAPVVPPSDFASSSNGYWSGYWTWNGHQWYWTWVWHPSNDSWLSS